MRGGDEHGHVTLATLDPADPLSLALLINQVVLTATDENVDSMQEAAALELDAIGSEKLADAGLPLYS